MRYLKSDSLIAVLGLCGLGLSAMGAGAATAGTFQADGRQIFLDSRCHGCHTVSSAGIKIRGRRMARYGPDLTGVTTRFEPQWLVGYLQKEQTLDGKAHATRFKGTDEELAALLDWLKEQKD